MIRIGATLAFMLAACAPPQQPAENSAPPATETAAAPGCIVETPARALRFGGQTYNVEARAEGPTCDQARAELRLRAPNGEAIFETAYPTMQVPLAFNATGSGEARLSTELEAWTQNLATDVPTADRLPAWPEGAEKPPHFTPAVAREAYEAARAARRPMFCFADGGESNACVAIDTGAQTALLLGSRTPERP